jgi:hypothetical protein
MTHLSRRSHQETTGANIIRPDWSERPHNSQGQYITKSEADLHVQWQREGGFEANVARVQAVEAKILSLSENPQVLQNHIAPLPQSIQLKAADVMRLATGYRQGGALKFEQFINSLTRRSQSFFFDLSYAAFLWRLNLNGVFSNSSRSAWYSLLKLEVT